MPRPSRTGVKGLYRDANGRYRIDLRWRDPDSGEYRRHRERLPPRTTAVAAKERARRILAAALAGEFHPEREAPKRLSALIDAYSKWAETNRPRSAPARGSHCKVLTKHLGDPLLDEISPLHIERMKRDYKNGGRAPATANRVLATFKHMIGLAANWGWIDGGLARRLRAVKLFKEPPGRVRYLSVAEHEALIGALPDALRPIVVVALLTGMRLGEILGIRAEHVDLSRRLLHVERTKNGRARRVPINDALAPVLEALVADATDGWLFVTARGKRHRSDSISRAFRRAATTAGVEDFHFHDLRHDFATRLRRKDVGLDIIAKLLGHQSLAMTQRYAHIEDPALVDAVADLSA